MKSSNESQLGYGFCYKKIHSIGTLPRLNVSILGTLTVWTPTSQTLLIMVRINVTLKSTEFIVEEF